MGPVQVKPIENRVQDSIHTPNVDKTDYRAGLPSWTVTIGKCAGYEFALRGRAREAERALEAAILLSSKLSSPIRHGSIADREVDMTHETEDTIRRWRSETTRSWRDWQMSLNLFSGGHYSNPLDVCHAPCIVFCLTKKLFIHIREHPVS